MSVVMDEMGCYLHYIGYWSYWCVFEWNNTGDDLTNVSEISPPTIQAGKTAGKTVNQHKLFGRFFGFRFSGFGFRYVNKLKKKMKIPIERALIVLERNDIQAVTSSVLRRRSWRVHNVFFFLFFLGSQDN